MLDSFAASFLPAFFRGPPDLPGFDLASSAPSSLALFFFEASGTCIFWLHSGQVMTVPPNVRHQALFVKLQRDAREAGRGLWSQAGADVTASGSSVR